MKLDSEDQRKFLLSCIENVRFDIPGKALMGIAIETEKVKLDVLKAELEEVEGVEGPDLKLSEAGGEE